MRALVIGGTGPTGPVIVEGLAARGYEPVILHRGTHEHASGDRFRHLHADPHHPDSVAEVLGSEPRFDLVVASYGRLRLLIGLLTQHSDRVVTVGGTAYARQAWSQPATESASRDTTNKLISRIQETEQLVLAHHADAVITHIRYPYLYGPRQLAPREWSIIRRIRDGRTSIPVIDGGLTLESRAYADNAAHAVLLAVDQPDKSAGRTYHVADETTPTDAERALEIARIMGAEIRLVNFPREFGRPGYFWAAGRYLDESRSAQAPSTYHVLLDTTLIRTELGYREQVPFEAAISRTVEWYLANPLEPQGDHEQRLGDPFDYVGEDRFLAALDRFAVDCADVEFAGVTIRHAYDHPGPKVAAPAVSSSGGRSDAATPG
jgi:nucleoside-diphosphate-sugar epimerase